LIFLPRLAEGLVFVITPFNQVIALDPATGVERWVFDPQIARDRAYSEASARGVAVQGGTVFFGTPEARLIALNAATGKKLWESSLGPATNDGNYQVTSAQVVVVATVIVGSSIGDNGRAEMERGAVSAFDSRTGKPEMDMASRPALVDAHGRPAVTVLTKMGHYFLLDRITGKPLLPLEERAVPERVWKANKFRRRSLSRCVTACSTLQKFEPRPGWCADGFAKLRYEGVFTPPTPKGTLPIFPATWAAPTGALPVTTPGAAR